MIIKFREERIADLEARLAKATEGSECNSTAPSEGCNDCTVTKKQLDDALRENS